MDICEQPGDRPLTIRTLTEIAEREGWSLDARLTFLDSEDEWEVVHGECCLAPLDLL